MENVARQPKASVTVPDSRGTAARPTVRIAEFRPTILVRSVPFQ
jgi:hypothetical protein